MGTPRLKSKIPMEITAIEMAEAFGQWPGDIMERRGSLRWMAWYKLYHAQLNKAREKLSEKK